uniref:Uncharacterized protein n=1 Tax=Anguilla anguilla TaxID=7936 RepID=A0A0E9VBS8_ANGAN
MYLSSFLTFKRTTF